MKKPKVFSPLNRNRETKQFNPRKSRDNMYKSTDWFVYRKAFLSINKSCYCCGHPATVVDHIVAAKDDRELFEKLDNHLPLCHICHNTITALFDRHAKQKLKEKLEWIAEKRKIHGINIVVKVLPKFGK